MTEVWDRPFRGREPNSVISSLRILQTVAALGPGVTAREICSELRMPKATVYRLLKNLVQEEFVVRSPDLTGYLLGVHALEIVRSATQTHASVVGDDHAADRPEGDEATLLGGAGEP